VITAKSKNTRSFYSAFFLASKMDKFVVKLDRDQFIQQQITISLSVETSKPAKKKLGRPPTVIKRNINDVLEDKQPKTAEVSKSLE
jgi:hypothetical protein